MSVRGSEDAPGSPCDRDSLAAEQIRVHVAWALVGSNSQRSEALDALQELSRDEANQELIVAAGGVPVLVTVARDGDERQRELAVCALAALSCRPSNTRVLISAAGGIPVVVKMLREGDDYQKSIALGALHNLALHADNKELVVAAGGIPPLVALVYDGDDEQRDGAATVLGNLAYKHESIAAQIVLDGGADALLGLLRDGNDGQKHSAAFGLAFLAADGETKALVEELGGVAILRSLVRDAEEKGSVDELSLAALRKLGLDTGEHQSEDGAGILSGVVHSGVECVGKAVSAIFSAVSGGATAAGQGKSCGFKVE